MKRFIAKLSYHFSGNHSEIHYQHVLGMTKASAEKKLQNAIRRYTQSAFCLCGIEILNFDDADNYYNNWHSLLCRKCTLTGKIAILHAKLKEANVELVDIEHQLAAYDEEPIA